MANFSKAVLARQDAERQMRLELKQALETIDLKASKTAPGISPVNESWESHVVADAKRQKWEKMVKESKDYAIKQHQIKYQLPDGSPGLQSGSSFDGSSGSPFGKL